MTVEMVVVVVVRLKGSPGESARTRSDGWWPGAFTAYIATCIILCTFITSLPILFLHWLDILMLCSTIGLAT